MRFMMYHKDYAPTGKEFDSEVDGRTPESLAKKGWVDNPAKIGINVWGPDSEADVQTMQQKFARGLVKALDEPAFVSADKMELAHGKSRPNSGQLTEEIEGLGDPSGSWGDYPLDDLLIRHESRTIHDVIRRIDSGAYVMDPDFQRDFIWHEDKQSKLIESVIMRIPLPVFYMAEDDEGRMVVVDGLQRLSTFQRFVHDELKLRLPERNELDKKKFSDLSSKLKNRIEDSNLIFYIIDSKVPEQARLDIFERVNGGVPLSRQQMRNCLFMGQATRFLKKEVQTEDFLRATGKSLKPSMMRDREFVNRFCAFQLLDLKEYRGDMDEFLANCLRKMNEMEEADLSRLSTAFRRSLANNYMLFGEHAFRKHARGQTRRGVINASLWDVMSTGLSLYDEKQVEGCADLIRDALYELLDDDDFKEAITFATGDTRRVKCRFQRTSEMFERILGAHPD